MKRHLKRHLHLSKLEVLYLERFFNGVDYAIAKELDTADVAYEEFLTPTLGRLLDDRSPFQSLLPYPAKKLNADLGECGSGNQLNIEFETHEHTKSHSGSVSHADLGIVFRRENPILGETTEKALIVESKRLYPIRKKYTLQSKYAAFSAEQYKTLKAIASEHGGDVPNAVEL